MKMRNILKLLGALAITTGSATSVVACGGDKPTPKVSMPAKVSEDLGLTNAKGVGLQVLSVDITTKADDVSWTIPASVTATQIKANALLVTPGTNSAAKDQDAFDFITKTLNVKPTTGTTLADGVFDANALGNIKATVTNIKPTLGKSTGTGADAGWAVTGGTFMFQFKDAAGKSLGDNYTVNLKIDATKDVVSTSLATIAAAITTADTNAATNTNTMFVAKTVVPAGAVKGAKIGITGTTNQVKQFNALSKLVGQDITAQLESASKTPNGTVAWAAGDTIILSYKVGDVDLDAATVKTTLTLGTAPSTKTELNTITLARADVITATSGQTYADIVTTELKNDQAFSSKPLADGYTVKYYTDGTSGAEITSTTIVPASGAVWITVTAANSDPNWTGTTARTEVTLTVS